MKGTVLLIRLQHIAEILHKMESLNNFDIKQGRIASKLLSDEINNRKITGGVYNVATVKKLRDTNIFNNYIRYNGPSISESLGELYVLPNKDNPIVSYNGNYIEGPLSDVGGLEGYTAAAGHMTFNLSQNNSFYLLAKSFNRRYDNSVIYDYGLPYFKNDYIGTRNNIDTSIKELYLNGLAEYTRKYALINPKWHIYDNMIFNPYNNGQQYGNDTNIDIDYMSLVDVNQGAKTVSAYPSIKDTYFGDDTEQKYPDLYKRIYPQFKSSGFKEFKNGNGSRYKFLLDNYGQGISDDYKIDINSYLNSFSIDSLFDENKISIKKDTLLDIGITRASDNIRNEAMRNNILYQPQSSYFDYGKETSDGTDIYSLGEVKGIPDKINGNPEMGYSFITNVEMSNVYSLYNEQNDKNDIHEINEGDVNISTNEFVKTINEEVNSIKQPNTELFKRTNRLFRDGKIHSMMNRFYVQRDNVGSQFESAISSFGVSRGRNLLTKDAYENKKVDVINNYENPYCRVWTTHHQYSKMKDRIRPFIKDDMFLSIKDTQTDYGELRPHNGSDRLQTYGVIQDNGLPRITSMRNDNGEFDSIKNYMFSIENLAWVMDGNRLLDNLSEEQIGPNNGRIMWFPPYNLTFSENVAVNWNENEFIGRGEKIFTYKNTDRKGTLSFTLLVDHPSIVNKWRDENPYDLSGGSYGANYLKNSLEQSILRYFAGCGDLDYVSTQNTQQEIQEESSPASDSTPKKDNIKLEYVIFFPNNYSGYDSKGDYAEVMNQLFAYGTDNWIGSDESYKEQTLALPNRKNLPKDYKLNNVQNGEWGCKDDIYTTLGFIKDEKVYSLTDLALKNYMDYLTDSNGDMDNSYEIKNVIITGCASSHGYEDLNQELCDRRRTTASNIVKGIMNIDDEKISPGENRIIEVNSPTGYEDINELSAKIGRCAIISVEIGLKDNVKPSNPGVDTIIYDDSDNVDWIENLPEISITSQRPEKKYEYDNEFFYFSKLKETDDIAYKMIVDKVKYFNPAFHSVTPEGFNARLTFLHQCTRQGPTNSISEGEKTGVASNLAFGKSPYCVLRIGDFFNTKIVIQSVNINFDTNNGMSWDLNPEGIGVQPMTAKVELSFTFIGGQDISGPVARLQNAVTYNYYANTSVYDKHSDYKYRKEDGNVIGFTYDPLKTDNSIN